MVKPCLTLLNIHEPIGSLRAIYRFNRNYLICKSEIPSLAVDNMDCVPAAPFVTDFCGKNVKCVDHERGKAVDTKER